jgi:hypothetical protein
MSFNFTTFDAALQAKLNTASVNLTAQDYLLLTKAVAAAVELSEGVSLLDLKNTANGVAGLDSNSQVSLAQLALAVPSQGGNSGKFLTTNGTATSWATVDAFPSQSTNSGKILTTNGTATSWTGTPSLTSLTTSGDVTVGDDIFVGPGAPTFHATLTDSSGTFVVAGAQDSYGQLAFKNTEPSSSSDIIAYSAEGDDTAGWIDMGITGATFDSANYGITGPHDGYIFMQAVPGTDGAGNLVIATGNNGLENKIVFAAGGYASGNTQMEIIPDQNVHIEIDTPSTSSTTGALTVVGGVGIQGDMNINGDVSIQGTITFGGAGTTVETSNLSVSDPLVFVGASNPADILDLGLVGEYTTGGNTKYAGIVRDASDGVIKTFKNATTKPTSTVNFSEAGIDYADMQVAGLTASSITVGNVSNTEFGYLDGVTSGIQTQINNKLDSSTASSTYLSKTDASSTYLTQTNASSTYLTQTNASTTYAPLAAPTFTGTVTLPSTTSIGTVSATEIGYVDGVTSAIQTQLNSKLATTTAASTYAPLLQTTSTPTFSSNAYTLISSDADKILLASNGSTAATLYVPAGVFNVGQVITIVQTGTGQITLQASATTLNSNGSKYKLNGQFASCQLICTASNTFLVIGNMAS